MNKAVFLDRDGTVTEEVGYLRDLEQLRLIPGAGTAIEQLNKAGFKVVLITNQSGVARGYFTESLVHEAHDRLEEMLRTYGARLDGVYFCPHHPTAGASLYTMACACRKPEPGLIIGAARDLGIDVSRSYMVGDKWVDVEVARRAGARAVLVMSGYAPDDPGNVRPSHLAEPDFIAHDIVEAAAWIIQHDQAEK